MELRNIEECTIERAIAHVLDKNADQPLLAGNEIELEPGVTAFLTMLITKALNSDKNRKVRLFNPNGVVYKAVKNSLDTEQDAFVESSKAMAEWLFKCIQEHPVIPSGDLIVVQFNTNGERCIATLQMQYEGQFVHDIQFTENESFDVDIVTQETALTLCKSAFFKSPGNDKYDAVILDPVLKAEDGSVLEYFQKTFVQGAFLVDHRDATKIMRDQLEKWVRNNMKDDMRNAISARADIESVFVNHGEMNVSKLTEEIIEDPSKREKFIENMERKGIDTDESFTIDKKFVAKALKTKAIKTDTGFTIRGPFENFHDNTKIEIEYNGDGTVNYIVKGVRNVSER